MESNLLLEQYSWYKKQQLAESPFKCLLNADIEPNPHQINAFCAAIQALKTGGIILADEVGLGKTIEAGLVLNYVLDNGAKKVLISLPATLRKQWEVELLEKFGRQAEILDRYTVEHNKASIKRRLENTNEISIVIASYDFSSKLIRMFPHVKWDFLIIDEAHLANFAVDADARCQGIGWSLLTHGLRVCYEGGARVSFLEVRAGNGPAIHLYEKAGYHTEGVRKQYYQDNHEDAVMMNLDTEEYEKLFNAQK